MKHSVKTRKKLLRLIAFLTVQCFTWTTIAQGAPAVPSTSSSAVWGASPNLSPFLDLPAKLARLESVYLPDNAAGALVYLIQDAHASQDAQEKIENILRYLKVQKRLDLVLVEGASGKLSPENMTLFPSKDQNGFFWNVLNEKGLISGVEKFLLLDSDVAAQGIESADLYRANLEIYRAVLSKRKESDEFLRDLREKLLHLPEASLSRETERFLDQWETAHDRPENIAGYLKTLFDHSARHLDLDWKDPGMQEVWPNMVRIRLLSELADKLDRQKTRDELAALEKLLGSRIPETLRDLRFLLGLPAADIDSMRELPFKPRDLAESLVGELTRLDLSLAPYPHLKQYLTALIFQTEIDSIGLWREIEGLEDRILAVIAQSQKARQNVALRRDLHLLTRALRLELSREEAQQFSVRAEDFSIERWKRDLGSPRLRHEDTERPLVAKITEFYKGAEAREPAFLLNSVKAILDLLEKDPKTVRHIAIVVGGYHRSEFQRVLKKGRVPYLTVQPSFNGESDPIFYQNSLMGKYPRNSYLPAARAALMPLEITERMIGAPALKAYAEHALGALRENAVRHGLDPRKLMARAEPRKLEGLFSAAGLSLGELKKETVPLKGPGPASAGPAKTRASFTVSLLRSFSRLVFFTLLAGAGGMIAGCVFTVREEVEKKMAWTPPKEKPALVLPAGELDLSTMRGMLIQNNYEVKEAELTRDLRLAEEGLLGLSLRLESQIGFADGKLSASAGAITQLPGVGTVGVRGTYADKFSLVTNLAGELLRYLTGERVVSEMLAQQLTQVSVYELERTIDAKYEEASFLLIQIRDLQIKREILKNHIEKLKEMSLLASKRSELGLEIEDRKNDISSKIAGWEREMLRTEGMVRQMTDQLMNLISPTSQDLGRSFLAQVDLEHGIDEVFQTDLEFMKERASRFEGMNPPRNRRLAAVWAGWQAMVIREKYTDLKLLPSIDLGLLYFKQWGDDTSSSQSGASQTSSSGKAAKKKPVEPAPQTYTNNDSASQEKKNALIDLPNGDWAELSSGLNFSWELGAVPNARRSMAAIDREKAGNLLSGTKRDLELEITSLVNAVNENTAVITKTESELRRQKAFLEDLRRKTPEGRPLVSTTEDPALKAEEQVVSLEIERLKAKTNRKIFVERLRILGALKDFSWDKNNKVKEVKVEGRSLGSERRDPLSSSGQAIQLMQGLGLALWIGLFAGYRSHAEEPVPDKSRPGTSPEKEAPPIEKIDPVKLKALLLQNNYHIREAELNHLIAQAEEGSLKPSMSMDAKIEFDPREAAELSIRGKIVARVPNRGEVSFGLSPEDELSMVQETSGAIVKKLTGKGSDAVDAFSKQMTRISAREMLIKIDDKYQEAVTLLAQLWVLQEKARLLGASLNGLRKAREAAENRQKAGLVEAGKDLDIQDLEDKRAREVQEAKVAAEAVTARLLQMITPPDAPLKERARPLLADLGAEESLDPTLLLLNRRAAQFFEEKDFSETKLAEERQGWIRSLTELALGRPEKGKAPKNNTLIYADAMVRAQEINREIVFEKSRPQIDLTTFFMAGPTVMEHPERRREAEQLMDEFFKTFRSGQALDIPRSKKFFQYLDESYKDFNLIRSKGSRGGASGKSLLSILKEGRENAPHSFNFSWDLGEAVDSKNKIADLKLEKSKALRARTAEDLELEIRELVNGIYLNAFLIKSLEKRVGAYDEFLERAQKETVDGRRFSHTDEELLPRIEMKLKHQLELINARKNQRVLLEKLKFMGALENAVPEKKEEGIIKGRSLGESQQDLLKKVKHYALVAGFGIAIGILGSWWLGLFSKGPAAGPVNSTSAPSSVVSPAAGPPAAGTPALTPSGPLKAAFKRSGETVPLFWDGIFTGESFKAKTAGQIEFIDDKKVDYKAGEPMLRIVDKELEAALEALKIKRDIVKVSLEKISASNAATQKEILDLERALNSLIAQLNSLEREKKELGTYVAPFPLKMTQKRYGAVKLNDPLFEYIPKDRVRIAVTLPLEVSQISSAKIVINGASARIIRAVREKLDPKHQDAVLVLDVLLENPLEDLTEKLKYEISMDQNRLGIVPLSAVAEGEWASYSRVYAREEINVLAPETMGRLVFEDGRGQRIGEAQFVKKEEKIARAEGKEFYESEIKRETELLKKIEDFLKAITPREGQSWQIRLTEADALKAEAANLPILKARSNLLTVSAPADGLLINSSFSQAQAVRPGERVAKILTDRVVIGTLDAGELASMILVKDGIDMRVGDPVAVRAANGQVFKGNILGIQREMRSSKADLKGFQALKIEVLDPGFLLHPGMPVQVIWKKDKEALLKEIPPLAPQELSFGIPVQYQGSEVPLLVESALMENADKPAERLTELILQESNPRNRLEAFDHFVRYFRGDDFSRLLERIIFEGRPDVAQLGLRLLRDEQDIVRLAKLFERSVRGGAANTTAASWSREYIIELIESWRSGGAPDPITTLDQESRLDPDFRKTSQDLLLSILEAENGEGAASLRILRSSFWTNRELAALTRHLDGAKTIPLAALLKHELLRRIAYTKEKDHRFGYPMQFLTKGFLGVRFTEGEDLAGFMMRDHAMDAEFFTRSPYWEQAGDHVETSLWDSSKSDLEKMLEVDPRPAARPIVITDLLNVPRPQYPGPFWDRSTLEEQENWINDLAKRKQWPDLVRLLEVPEVQKKYGERIVTLLIQEQMGRLQLARSYAAATDNGTLSMIEAFNLDALLLKDVQDLSAGKGVPRPENSDPASYTIYQKSLAKAYVRAKTPVKRLVLVRMLMAFTVPSEFELSRLADEQGFQDSRSRDLEASIPRAGIRDAARYEIERRAVLFAIALAREKFGYTNAIEFTPGVEGTRLETLQQELAVENLSNPSLSNSGRGSEKSPLELLRDVMEEGNRVPETKEMLGYVDQIARKRVSDIQLRHREKISLYDVFVRSFAYTVIKFIVGLFLFFFGLSWLWRGYRLTENHWDARSEPSLDEIRAEIRLLRAEVNDEREAKKYEGTHLKQHLNDWMETLLNPELSEEDCTEMLLKTKYILNDKKLVYSPSLLKNPLYWDVVAVGHIYRIVTQLSILTMQRIYLEGKVRGTSASLAERKKLYYTLRLFADRARYSSGYRFALNPITNLKLTSSYQVPELVLEGKNPVVHIFQKLENQVSLFLYRMIRALYGISFAWSLGKRKFLRSLQSDIIGRGNAVEPGLYSADYLEQSEKIIQTAFRFQTRPVDELGMQASLGKRRLITRMLPFFGLAPFVLLPLSIFFGFGIKVDLITGLLTMTPGVILALYFHLAPILKGWHDPFYQWSTIFIDTIERKANAVLLEGRGDTNGSRESADQMKSLEFERAVDALHSELASPDPSADIVVVIYNHRKNEEKEIYLKNILDDKLRKDVPVFFDYCEIKGSAAAYLTAHQRARELYGRYREDKVNYPHLPDSFEKARVIVLLAGGSKPDIISTAEGSDSLIPLPIRVDGHQITTLEAALMNAYKASQELAKKGKFGEVIMPGGNFYLGPIRRTGDITLLGSWSSFEEAVDTFGIVFGYNTNDKQAVKFIEKPGRAELRELIQDNPKVSDQVDLENPDKYQMPAFTGGVIFSFDQDRQREAFRRMMGGLGQMLENTPAPMREEIQVDMTLDILIPLIKMTQGESLNTYMARRVRDLSKPVRAFYSDLLDFYNENRNALQFNNSLFIPHHAESTFLDLRSVSAWDQVVRDVDILPAALKDRALRSGSAIVQYSALDPGSIIPDDGLLYGVRGKLGSQLPAGTAIFQVPFRIGGQTRWLTFYSHKKDELFKSGKFFGIEAAEILARLKDRTGQALFPEMTDIRKAAIFPLIADRDLRLDSILWIDQIAKGGPIAMQATSAADFTKDKVSLEWIVDHQDQIDFGALWRAREGYEMESDSAGPISAPRAPEVSKELEVKAAEGVPRAVAEAEVDLLDQWMEEELGGLPPSKSGSRPAVKAPEVLPAAPAATPPVPASTETEPVREEPKLSDKPADYSAESMIELDALLNELDVMSDDLKKKRRSGGSQGRSLGSSDPAPLARATEESVLETAYQVTYSILRPELSGPDRKRLIERIKEFAVDPRRHAREMVEILALGTEAGPSLEQLLSQAMTYKKAVAPEVPERTMMFLDARMVDDQGLKRLVKGYQPVVVIFEERDRGRYRALQSLLKISGDGSVVHPVLAPARMSDLVNRAIQPGNVRSDGPVPGMRDFLKRHLRSDIAESADQMVFLSANKKDANSVQRYYVSRRYYYEDQGDGERTAVSDALLLLINGRVFFRSGTGRYAENLQDTLRQYLTKMIEEFRAAAEIKKAA